MASFLLEHEILLVEACLWHFGFTFNCACAESVVFLLTIQFLLKNMKLSRDDAHSITNFGSITLRFMRILNKKRLFVMQNFGIWRLATRVSCG